MICAIKEHLKPNALRDSTCDIFRRICECIGLCPFSFKVVSLPEAGAHESVKVAMDAEPETKLNCTAIHYKTPGIARGLFMTLETQAQQNADEHEDIGVHLLVQFTVSTTLCHIGYG